MKKLTLILFLSVLFFGLKAQEEEIIKNRFVLGGSVSFFGNKSETILNNNLNNLDNPNDIGETTGTILLINPTFGKELNPHWILGVQLGFSIQNSNSKSLVFLDQFGDAQIETNRKEKTIGLNIGLFSRYTFNPSQRFNFFLQPSVGYGFSKQDRDPNLGVSQSNKIKSITSDIRVGILYKFNDRLRAFVRAGGLFYSRRNWEYENVEGDFIFTSFEANLSLSNTIFGVEIRL